MAAKTRVAPRPSASRKAAAGAGQAKSAARSSRKGTAGDEIVTIDRRRGSRRAEAAADDAEPQTPVKLERRQKTQRRRQIDPTTCERDYSIDEVEFMNAMDDYKRKSGRMFPTCSEVLEVIRALGYVKLSPSGRAILAAEVADADGEFESAE